jgi:hypothetical protein
VSRVTARAHGWYAMAAGRGGVFVGFQAIAEDKTPSSSLLQTSHAAIPM